MLQALEWAENPDSSDTENAGYIRIENKIRKELGKSERKLRTREQAKAERELGKRWERGEMSQAEYMAELGKIYGGE